MKSFAIISYIKLLLISFFKSSTFSGMPPSSVKGSWLSYLALFLIPSLLGTFIFILNIAVSEIIHIYALEVLGDKYSHTKIWVFKLLRLFTK